MTPEQQVIEWWLTRARKTLDEASTLIGAGHTIGSVNRLYYACFYAVSALLLSEGQSSSKHSGVKALFHRDWVKPGRVPAEAGRFYQLLFDRRMAGDYAALTDYTHEEVAAWLTQAREFVASIAGLLEAPS